MNVRPGPRNEGTGPASVMTMRLSGELDMASAAEVRACLRSALAGYPAQVSADLADVEFIDCAGLSLLLECARDARAVGCSFTVTTRSTAVEHLLALTGARLD